MTEEKEIKLKKEIKEYLKICVSDWKKDESDLLDAVNELYEIYIRAFK